MMNTNTNLQIGLRLLAGLIALTIGVIALVVAIQLLRGVLTG
jgi:hypothetical protein